MAGGSSKGPRYAPEDPTLPKPWRELIDGASGYHYYWNPETNVTQYERPVTESLPPPPPGPPPGVAVSSSVRSQHRDDGRRSGAAARSRSHQSSRAGTKGHGAAPPDDGGGLTGDAYCRHHEITVTGDEAPAPFTTFESTSFPMEILKEVQHAGFSAPTPIQAQSWPIALKGFDIVAVAKTGSGKTLGYLLPGFIHLKNRRNNPKVGPTVLVLAPTRELATQIQDEAEKFGRTSRIASTCLYGGAPKGPQLRDLERGVDIVVATPGRLNDILEMRKISLRQVSYLVLDEADRMLDMGFEPQIRKIVEQIPERRQTLMFTATWPKEVRNISKDLLVHPIQVNIGGTDELVANKAITQYVEVLSPNEKQKRVEQILRSQEPNAKVLIFCSTKKMCDQLTRTLDRRFGAVAIHGDKSQGERDRVLSHFRTGRSPILVATDVASRGLDIKDIRVVINYDFPTDIEDYVHRIGRTGRAGATGVSYTFFCDKDSKYALDLAKVLEGASQHVPPELRDLARRGKRGGGGKRRWRSSPNRGRDSSYGGRGGRGFSQSCRSDAHRGRRGYSDDELPKRYDRGLHGTKGNATSVNHKARGRSPSRSCSSSLSPSPKRRRVELGNGRRDSKSWDHNRGSRSRSISQGLDGGAGPDHSQSPPSKRVVPSNDHHLTSNPAQSPIPNYDQRPLQQKSPQSFDNGSTKDAEISRTLSSMKEKSQSPCNSMDNGKHVGANSPTQWNQKNSPNCDDETIEVEGKGPVPSPRRIHKHGEEEEGMIPADDDGTNLPEVVRSSPDRPYQVSGLNVETAE